MKPLTSALAILCLASAAAASAVPGTPPAIEVQNGWVRWLPGGLPAAGYLTISNHGDKALALVAESSPDYGQVMLHRTVNNGGTEHMEMVERLTIPAHGSVKFSPGNYHLMLMHAVHPVAPGNTIHLKLEFSDGSAVDAELKVRPPTQIN